jgi:hypothetical protein
MQFSLDCTIGTNYTNIVQREGTESVIARKVFAILPSSSIPLRRANVSARHLTPELWWFLQVLVMSTLPHLSQTCSIKINMRRRLSRTRLDDVGC